MSFLFKKQPFERGSIDDQLEVGGELIEYSLKKTIKKDMFRMIASNFVWENWKNSNPIQLKITEFDEASNNSQLRRWGWLLNIETSNWKINCKRKLGENAH